MSKLKEYKFDELYTISSGISTKPTQAGHGTPFLSFSTIFNNPVLPEKLDDKMDTNVEEQEKYSVKQGDIFLTRTSETLDELAMSSVAFKDYPEATFSGFAKRLRPIQNNITYYRFMAFYLRSPYFRKIIDANASMTLRASFSEDTFSNLYIQLPDFKVQVQIGDFFWSIEKKIRNNNKISIELESLARTVYDYWFLQFDFPDEKGRPYRSSGGRMVYNEELKSEIPEGWEAKKLRDISTLLMNTVNPYDNPDKEYLHYSIPAFDDTGYPSIELGEEISSGKYIVPDDSILVSKLNPQFKRVWSPQVNGNNCICSTEFIPFVAINKEIHGYLYSVLDSDSFQQYMMQCSSSSTGSRKRMQPELCGDFTIAYPKDKKIIEKFSRFIDRILSKKANCSVENQQLTSLRDFLLPLLMNGQVTFKH